MKKKSLYEVIYDDLLEQIKQGKYTQGSKLPSEKELADSYQVSRITSKRALEQLAEEDFIVRMPGKGSFVKEEAVSKEQRQDMSEQEVLLDVQRPQLVGVIMEGFAESFGTKLVLGMEEEFRQYGYNMIFRCSQGNQKEEEAAINDLLSLNVLGLIIMCAHDENYSPKILELAVSGFPMILLDRQMKGIPLSFAGINNHDAARDLTDYLFEKGHRKIAFVSSAAMDTPTIADRFSGYIDSNLAHGIITNGSLWMTNLRATIPNVQADEKIVEEDLLKMKRFLLEHTEVTAFLAVEYEIAKMLKKALEDVYGEKAASRQIVCFDGPDNVVHDFEFTHVRQDELKIGKTAADMLFDAISGHRDIRCNYLPYEIVIGYND